MTGAILGGFGAAVAFAMATLCSSRSTRMIGEAPVLGWVMVVGLVAVTPFLAFGPRPASLDRTTIGWLVVAGVGNACGLLLAYRALRFGQVAVVAPIVSTEGAITALIALLGGESLSATAWATLAVIVAGIVLSATHDDDTERPGAVSRADARHAAGFAVFAALAFGVSLYGTGRLSDELPIAWLVMPARVAGTLAVAVPLLLSRRLRLTRRAAPLVVAAGLGEVFGFVSFTLGARHGIAVAAVLASQFAAIAAVMAYAVFGERLARVQVVGVTAIVAGVAVLSALQA